MGLFKSKPKWINADREIALEEIEKLSNQKTLAVVAKGADDWQVGLAAVKKLTDQKIIADVAKSVVVDDLVRITAVDILTDQSAIVDYVINARIGTGSALVIAVGRLTDNVLAQRKYTELVKEATAWEVRKSAIENIADQVIIAEIAISDDMTLVREAAVMRVENQAVLGNIANDGAAGVSVRGIAISRITDQGLLTHIAKNGIDWSARLLAADRLTDKTFSQKIYCDIAENSEFSGAREAAKERLSKLAT